MLVGVALLTAALVSVPRPGLAAVYTVGTGGNYTTIQAAVDAAVVGGGDNEIRVLQGTYGENVVIPVAFSSGSLLMTGGWRAGFTTRSQDPALTVVNGLALGTVLTIRSSGGVTEVYGFSFTNGRDNFGGGVEIATEGAATVRVRDVIVENNLGTASSAVYGGGVYIDSSTGSVIELSGAVVRGNTAESTASEANGAGIHAIVENDSTVRITHNVVDGNVCRTLLSHNSAGGGVYAYVYDTAMLEFSDNVVVNNVSAGEGDALYTGAYLGAWSTATTLEARRNLFWNNSSTKTGFEGSMLGTHLFESSTAVFSDSVVAGGGNYGIQANAYGASTLTLTNLTVSDFPDAALKISSSSTETAHLSNILSWNLGASDTIGGSGSIVSANNHSGVDPLFIDAAAANFQLQPSSPAIDYGSNLAPGLGDTDLAGGPRLHDSAVDAGAYEHGNIFGNGFESGTSIHWSSRIY